VKLTLIHPAIGRRPGVSYMRTWQMEPLPIAVLVGLTPPDVDIRFHDDRMEAIPFDEPTDLVAIPVETYTAKRAYQIASEYRRRGVPVVMGGFHATLAPDEVARYAESVVFGEAENVWAEVIDDARHGKLKPTYRAAAAARIPPVICENQYGSTQRLGKRPAAAKPRVTAGLKWAADIGPKAEIIAVTASPEASAAASRLGSPPAVLAAPERATGAKTIPNVPTSSATQRRAIPWIMSGCSFQQSGLRLSP